MIILQLQLMQQVREFWVLLVQELVQQQQQQQQQVSF
jgi:hypothetical protein